MYPRIVVAVPPHLLRRDEELQKDFDSLPWKLRNQDVLVIEYGRGLYQELTARQKTPDYAS